MSDRLASSVAYSNRREFLKRSSAAAGVAMAGALPLARGVHAAGSDVIKIGLIGSGGRGSGAAVNAMNAGPDVRLVAMGDIFKDRLTSARQQLQKAKPEQVQVDDKQCFVGWDAFQKVLQTDIQVVLIASASHFHPQFFQAAAEAGKHIFCEKPHAVDVPGLKTAMAANELAKKKNLAVMSGLCWRHDPAVQETMRRVLDGEIGDVLAIQENYLSSPYNLRVRQPEWNEMQYQMQNWYHFNWLSGDQTGQQLIHSIDKASWALRDKPPLRAYGVGGRQVCLEPKYGDQFDHHGVVFEYEDGVRVFGFCRDQPDVFNETADYIIGTKGRAYLPNKCRIDNVKGETVWKYDYPKKKVSMYDVEHEALFASIRAGKPCNSGSYMFTSTMLGILAQMVCYTGKAITWEEAMQSTKVLGPSSYSWDAEPPVKPNADGTYPSPMPGMT